MLDDLRSEMYSLIERVKTRAELMDRTLDAHDMARIEALAGQIELFTKQHHKNCE